MAAMLLIDHRRLTMFDLGPDREALDDEGAEVIDVAHRDVDLKIVDAGHVKHA